MKIIFIISILFFSNIALCSDYDDLKKKHDAFIATAAGKKYEMEAVNTFWGEATFMQTCAPSNAPVPEPFDIIFIVQTNGQMTDIYLFPETQTGKCIKKHVKDRLFSAPPAEFVGYIKMAFTH